MGQTLADALGAALAELPVYDTHKHIYRSESHITDVMDYFVDYTSTDLASAGMRDEEWEGVNDRQGPRADRWSILEPYWARVQHTGYGAQLDVLSAIDSQKGTGRGHTVKMHKPATTLLRIRLLMQDGVHSLPYGLEPIHHNPSVPAPGETSATSGP